MHSGMEIEILQQHTSNAIHTLLNIDGVYEISATAVWNMNGVTEPLSETQSQWCWPTYLVTTLANIHQEIIGLDVMVDKFAGMDVLDMRYLCLESWVKAKDDK